MRIENECWGEQQGIQGCAACSLREEWINFLQGKGLNERCRPKMERQFGKQTVEDMAGGKAQLDPGPAIDKWSRGII